MNRSIYITALGITLVCLSGPLHLVCCAAAVSDQDTDTGRIAQDKGIWPQGDPAGPSGPGTGLLVRTVISLLVVLAMIVGLAWVMNRLGPRLRKVQGRQIRLVETMPLGARRALHVVEFAGRCYLISSTTSQISLLASGPSEPSDTSRS